MPWSWNPELFYIFDILDPHVADIPYFFHQNMMLHTHTTDPLSWLGGFNPPEQNRHLGSSKPKEHDALRLNWP